MKFTNLVLPIGSCPIGEVVRLSRSNQLLKIISKTLFSVTCLIVDGGGAVSLPSNRNVHRKID